MLTYFLPTTFLPPTLFQSLFPSTSSCASSLKFIDSSYLIIIVTYMWANIKIQPVNKIILEVGRCSSDYFDLTHIYFSKPEIKKYSMKINIQLI